MRSQNTSPRAQTGPGSSRLAHESSRLQTPTGGRLYQFGVKGTMKPINLLKGPADSMMGANGMDLTPIIQWMNYKQDIEHTLS